MSSHRDIKKAAIPAQEDHGPDMLLYQLTAILRDSGCCCETDRIGYTKSYKHRTILHKNTNMSSLNFSAAIPFNKLDRYEHPGWDLFTIQKLFHHFRRLFTYGLPVLAEGC